jgi:hypothetical protein
MIFALQSKILKTTDSQSFKSLTNYLFTRECECTIFQMKQNIYAYFSTDMQVLDQVLFSLPTMNVGFKFKADFAIVTLSLVTKRYN